MGQQIPAKLLRAVKRITKFAEGKRLVLTIFLHPRIDIPPVSPKLSIAHVQTTNVLSQPKHKPSLVISKTVMTSFMPEWYQPDDESNTKPLSYSHYLRIMENLPRNRTNIPLAAPT